MKEKALGLAVPWPWPGLVALLTSRYLPSNTQLDTGVDSTRARICKNDLHSVSVKEIFQRVADAWSLKFVRQRENGESQ